MITGSFLLACVDAVDLAPHTNANDTSGFKGVYVALLALYVKRLWVGNCAQSGENATTCKGGGGVSCGVKGAVTLGPSINE